MKKLITLLFFVATALLALGQNSTGDERWKLAIYVTGDAPQPIKTITQNKVATALTNSGSYQLIERSAEFLKAITQEQKYQQSGDVDDNQITKLGIQYGAKFVCVVHITLMADANYIQIAMRMIDVERATSESAGEAESGNYQGPTDIDGVVNTAVKQMLGSSVPTSGSVNRPVVRQQGGGQNITFTLPGGQKFKMVYVEGGTFVMGCTSEQSGQCESDESPAHNVSLGSYYMAEYEVTQSLWQAVMGTTIYNQQSKASASSTYGVGDNLPMYYISHTECEEFCGRLNNLLRDQLPQGFKFRLPTEAQWEYAARGGVNAKPTIYSGSDYVSEVAWYTDNSGGGVKQVGLKDPNELGLYDMSGNVYEWCADWYSSSFYSSSPQHDPKNLSSGSSRVARGGSWIGYASYCRVSFRSNYSPGYRYSYVGFRLALVQ